MPAAAQPAVAPPRRRKRARAALYLLLLLLAVAVVPPLVTLNRFRARLEAAMSAAVGRRVSVEAVRLRLLPRPGFELKRFIMEDDPALSAEPMLRAQDVSADLRLASLWRGRVEISRLDLKNPSLNLVRAEDGRWSLEELLAHASAVPSAPTANPSGGARPRFPYIGAEGGRINFKIGAEKKVYALADADFALWQASEQEWELRLAGRPLRSDADLNNIGTLRLSGRFSRAPAPRQARFRLALALENAQLGQFTQLIYGRDRGWRGAVNARAQLTGSADLLHIGLSAAVKDFRRYDIGAPDTVALAADCQAIYSRAAPDSGAPALRGACTLPEGKGVLHVNGEYLPASRSGSLTLLAADFPMDDVVRVFKHMKRGVAADLAAAGAVNGRLRFQFHAAGQPPAPVAGADSASILTARASLRSQRLGAGLDLGTLVLSYQPATRAGARAARKLRATPPPAASLSLLPVRLSLGAAAPLVVSGWASSAGYEISLKGEAALAPLRNLLGALGLAQARPATPLGGAQSAALALIADQQPALAAGTLPAQLPPLATRPLRLPAADAARVDLRFSGAWAGFAPATVAGEVRPLAPTALARQR